MMTDELLDRSDDGTESFARLEGLNAFCEGREEGEVAKKDGEITEGDVLL